MQDLRAQLAESLDVAEWQWLAPHARRDSIIVVDRALDLVDVGIAIANDNITSVQHWIEESLIQKPSSSQISNWNANQTRQFNALIVQPYVLVQEVDPSAQGTDS
jgi:hypothetical protein